MTESDGESSVVSGLTEKAVELTKRRRRSSTPWENYLEKRKEKRARKREDDQQERERKKVRARPGVSGSRQGLGNGPVHQLLVRLLFWTGW